ncbi:oxidoreductase [Streptomyces montanus]|uniref:Oxidoreductase n=1 Tax=Streptomyces montanus TaxID=2580423 RepID=A0A5R9FZC8_9ACTN|nr:SAF domain-containing protein [Streptomyces montanus]TLS47386.1 oxidoreductase [Streptomyces montanus]
MAYLPQIIERQRQLGRPIRVGLVGAGQMGIGLVAQTNRIPGMEVAAIADIAPGRADAAFRRTGRENVVSTPDVDKLNAALAEGRPVALEDAGLLVRLDLDIIVEASGVPEVGAAVALNGLLSGKDIALLNVETDVTVGLLLSALARRMGRVYTVCRGDEPVECKRLVDYALDLGLTVTCAGKGKNNPLDPTATPDGLAAQAAAKNMNPKMLTSFVDGSKTMIEMAALANATGLRVSRRGFNGPRTTVPELAEVFRPKADGGILDAAGVVDYCTGPVAPGVFVVAKCDDPVVVAEMDYLSMGSGPYYTFYRPYHLASVEAPLTIAEAVLTRRPSLAPTTWTAEVVACAKRDLRAGELLDGIGGSTVYGVTDHAATAAAEGMVPLGLAAGARVLRDVPAGSPLTTRDVDIKQDTVIAALRRLQDLLLAGSTLDALLPLPTAAPGTAPQSAFAAPLGT